MVTVPEINRAIEVRFSPVTHSLRSSPCLCVAHFISTSLLWRILCAGIKCPTSQCLVGWLSTPALPVTMRLISGKYTAGTCLVQRLSKDSGECRRIQRQKRNSYRVPPKRASSVFTMSCGLAYSMKSLVTNRNEPESFDPDLYKHRMGILLSFAQPNSMPCPVEGWLTSAMSKLLCTIKLFVFVPIFSLS